tara:strand:- start:2 stop:208 length:207 start_codon:yes stop_codon:yes gene_type:complete
MEEPNSNDLLKSAPQAKDKKAEKKPVGQLFGVQLSAPEGMKNPLRIFLLLVFGNFLLLYLVGKGLGLF